MVHHVMTAPQKFEGRHEDNRRAAGSQQLVPRRHGARRIGEMFQHVGSGDDVETRGRKRDLCFFLLRAELFAGGGRSGPLFQKQPHPVR